MNEQYTGKDVLLRLRDTMHCRSTNELRRDAGNEIEQLRAEISRLTRELDEAKRENERLYAVFRSLGVIKYKDLPRALPAAPNEAGK